jgi:hypothetical protein
MELVSLINMRGNSQYSLEYSFSNDVGLNPDGHELHLLQIKM